MNGHSPKRLKQSWIEALWTKLHAIYGAKWADSYPSEIAEIAKSEWAEALADLSGEQIKVGLERCRRLLKFAPTPAEFIAEARAGMPEQPEVNRGAYLGYDRDKHPKRPSREVLGKAAHEATEHIKRAGPTGHRRCLFSAGYGRQEYERDLAQARAEGRSLYEVDMAAMARNGWTEEDEENWRANMLRLGLRGIMYAKGHEPLEGQEHHDPTADTRGRQKPGGHAQEADRATNAH